MTNLLIIDDNDTDLFIFKESIKIHTISFQCSLCHSGDIALEFIDAFVLANKCLPKLIVVDYVMPIMNGLEFIERLNARFPNLVSGTRIFLLSVRIEATVERQAKLLGVAGILIKPVTLQMLRYLETCI
ncbi:MAG: response regulator [Cyclobacteriaceae bacterium]|nr:response regulator [Cyclobacteriaceae bacterium]